MLHPKLSAALIGRNRSSSFPLTRFLLQTFCPDTDGHKEPSYLLLQMNHQHTFLVIGTYCFIMFTISQVQSQKCSYRHHHTESIWKLETARDRFCSSWQLSLFFFYSILCLLCNLTESNRSHLYRSAITKYWQQNKQIPQSHEMHAADPYLQH